MKGTCPMSFVRHGGGSSWSLNGLCSKSSCQLPSEGVSPPCPHRWDVGAKLFELHSYHHENSFPKNFNRGKTGCKTDQLTERYFLLRSCPYTKQHSLFCHYGYSNLFQSTAKAATPASKTKRDYKLGGKTANATLELEATRRMIPLFYWGWWGWTSLCMHSQKCLLFLSSLLEQEVLGNKASKKPMYKNHAGVKSKTQI